MINVYHNKDARQVIEKILLENPEIEDNMMHFLYIKQWFNNYSSPVKCYTIQDKHTEKVASMILLSKLDYDPFKEQSIPFLIDFIFTMNDFRRQNFALKLLIHIKDHDQTSAFCSNSESQKLFEKAGYDYYGNSNHSPLYRFMKASSI